MAHLKNYLRIIRPLCYWVSLFPSLTVVVLALSSLESLSSLSSLGPMTDGPEDSTAVLRGVLVIAVAMLLQTASNIMNDLADSLNGVDDNRPEWKPKRLVSSGDVPPKLAKVWMLANLGLAMVCGLILIVLVPALWMDKIFWLVIGGVSLLAAVGYSQGFNKKSGYGSRGLGELVSFIFFGPVLVFGSFWAILGDKFLPASEPDIFFANLLLALWLSVIFGIPTVLLMMVNNIRDIPTDKAAGKRTMPVRLGKTPELAIKRSKILFAVLSIVEFFFADVQLLGTPLFWVSLPFLFTTITLLMFIYLGSFRAALRLLLVYAFFLMCCIFMPLVSLL